MKVFLIWIIEITILSTTLVIIKLSVDNTENLKRFNLMLVSCIRTIPPQGIQGVSQILSKNRSTLFQLWENKYINHFFKKKRFTKINSRKIFKWSWFTKTNTLEIYIYTYIYIFFDSHTKISTPKLVILNIWFYDFRPNI